MSGFKMNKHKWLWALAWIVATYILYLCFREIKWGEALREIKNASIFWLLMACLFNIFILCFWARQWKAFLPQKYDVPFWRMFELNALMSMTMNTVPFLAGHAFGVVMLAKREKVGHAIALSVLALDQIAEAMAKFTLFSIVALLTPIPDIMRKGIGGVLLLLSLFFLVLMFFAFRHRDHQEPHEDEILNVKERVLLFISRWAHHLEPMRNVKGFSFGVVMAWAMKLMEGLGIWAVQKAFGLDLSIWTVCVVLAAVNLATMFPVAPGNLGIYEAAVFFIYKYIGLSPELAMGLAILQHLCYLLPKIALGYGILLMRNFYPLAARREPLTEET